MASSFSISCMVIIGLSYFPSGGVKPEVAKSADKIPPPDNFASEGISHLSNSVLSDTSAILIHWQADKPHPAISHLYQRILSIIHYFWMVSSRLLVIVTASFPYFRSFCTIFRLSTPFFRIFYGDFCCFSPKLSFSEDFCPFFAFFVTFRSK